MRQPRFLQIGIGFGAGPVDFSELDRAIESEAFDWMRISFACYIVWSSSDTETICRKILMVTGMRDASIVMFAVDTSDGFGVLREWAWEWLRRDRGPGSVTTWTPPWSPRALPTG